ncbi:CopG family transcriptional regulator [Geminocystis sp. CENA526]|uniref:CopG family transcriptional regulator n=1 Tax=Geminocystis sp. CENA526 TaxID=1355871 RepID=UPI003D6FBC58
MTAKKISISISADLAVFMENYKKSKDCKSISQIVEEALILLREKELENAYREANTEIDDSWDVLAGDGLSDETW